VKGGKRRAKGEDDFPHFPGKDLNIKTFFFFKH